MRLDAQLFESCEFEFCFVFCSFFRSYPTRPVVSTRPKKEKLCKFSAPMYSFASFTRLPSGYVPDLIAIACFIARALKSAFSA
jgi:hypothetical protein